METGEVMPQWLLRALQLRSVPASACTGYLLAASTSHTNARDEPMGGADALGGAEH